MSGTHIPSTHHSAIFEFKYQTNIKMVPGSWKGCKHRKKHRNVKFKECNLRAVKNSFQNIQLELNRHRVSIVAARRA